jgi:phosphatidylglycerophosphate synthase
MSSESFKEFKQITQGKKLEKRKQKKDWWHAGFAFISRYISRLLVKTNITANQITIFSIFLSLTGLLFIGLGNNFFIILGFILLYLYIVFDECDGEVARYKKQSSFHGIYYDQIGHLVIQGGLFFSLGYSIYSINGEILCLLLGFFSTLFLLGIRFISKLPSILYYKGANISIKQKEEFISKSQNRKKSFLSIIKNLVKNLMQAFSDVILIITIFFVGFLLYIFYDILWILEFFISIYSLFMFLAFLLFMVSKWKRIEKDVINFIDFSKKINQDK